MQVKNIESIQYFHDKFDVIDYPQKYLNFETHSTYLAEFEDCMVHTWPFLITNMGGLISEHVWPLTWKQKNKLGPRQGIYPKWGENVDINIPLPSQEFTDTNKFVWLPIDISSGNNPWHIWIDVIAKMRLLEKRLNKPFKDFVYIMPHRSEYMEKIITEIMPEIKLVVMPKDSTWKFKHIYVPTMCNHNDGVIIPQSVNCLLYTSPSPRD